MWLMWLICNEGDQNKDEMGIENLDKKDAAPEDEFRGIESSGVEKMGSGETRPLLSGIR